MQLALRGLGAVTRPAQRRPFCGFQHAGCTEAMPTVYANADSALERFAAC